jgi:TctA family transporter
LKEETKENLSAAATALIIVVSVIGLLPLMDWLGLDYQKWFGLPVWTATIFGTVLYVYERDLRRARCLVVFLLALALHVWVLVQYLRSAERFPNMFFFIFAPIETVAIAAALALLGGASMPRVRRKKRRPDQKWPPTRSG